MNSSIENWICLVLLFLALPGLAAQCPDLSGTWNPIASKGSPSLEDAAQLTVIKQAGCASADIDSGASDLRFQVGQVVNVGGVKGYAEWVGQGQTLRTSTDYTSTGVSLVTEYQLLSKDILVSNFFDPRGEYLHVVYQKE